MINYIRLDNGQIIELGDVAIPVDYNYSSEKVDDFNLGDSKDITKVFKIQGTAEINTIFNGLKDLNSTAAPAMFEPTLRTPCSLYLNGAEKMRGVLMVTGVSILKEDITYSVIVISDGADLFLQANTFRISQLDWTDAYHTFTKENIRASWSLAPISYYYALVNVGNHRDSPRSFHTDDFRPYLYAVDIFDRIMKRLNIPYQSDFLESIKDGLLYGYGGELPEEMSAGEINNRLVQFELNANTQEIRDAGLSTTASAPNVGGNPLIYFDSSPTTTTNYLYQGDLPPVAVTQDINNQLYANKIYVHQGGQRKLTLPTFQMSIKFDGLNDTVASFNGASFNFQIYVNYSFLDQVQLVPSWNGTDTLTLQLPAGYDFTYKYDPNDIVSFAVSYSGFLSMNNQSVTTSYIMESTLSYKANFEAINIELAQGVDVRPFWFISDMNASDYLKTIRKYFNLEFQKIGDVFKIEPYKEFYKGTSDIEDWSGKIDRSKRQEVTPLANNESKNLSFKVAEAEDFEFRDYRIKTLKDYGSREISSGSYYAKGTTEVETLTSTVIPVQVADEVGYVGTLVEPRFIDIEAGEAKEVQGIPRVGWKRLGVGTAGTSRFSLADVGDTNYTLEKDIGMIVDFSNDYFLHFSVPERKYHLLPTPNVALFDEFHLAKVNEFLGNTARSYECYIKIDDVERIMQDKRKYKLIDGSVWRLVKIEGFDQFKAGSFKAKFIKVVQSFGTPPNP